MKYKYRDFTLTVDEPTVILRGKPLSEVGWGPYQFPSLCRTKSGAIRYTCMGPGRRDDVDGYETGFLPFGRVSEDNGMTWREITAADEPIGVPLSNGHYYYPPKAKNAFRAEWIHKYTPDIPSPGMAPYGLPFPEYYDADRIPEYPVHPTAYDYDPETGMTESFAMDIHWPHLAITVHYPGTEREMVYPIETLMSSMGHIMTDTDGTLYISTYQAGFSSETGEPAFYSTVKILKSADNGRTWNYLSEILTDPALRTEKTAGGFDGFCEPYMERMPDGSFLILIRMGSNVPSYYARSTDHGKTWSKPEIFDKVGVFPQLLTLGCGVTLASYGRLGVYLRATSDETGLCWEDPIDLNVPMNGEGSCCYTSMLALDDNNALVAYSHFQYPDSDGIPKKTLLVRKIKVNN